VLRRAAEEVPGAAKLAQWRRRVSHGAPAGRYFKPAGARRLGELERGPKTRGLLRLHDHEGVSSWRL